ARPIRNHTNYQPTHVNADGSLPAYIRPHWLIPGLNKFFAAPVIPGEEETTFDRFDYIANDGVLDSNVAHVDITLAIVNAPQIVSTPLTGASPGFAYEYGALATDADFGDTLSWTLVDAPAGMTVDALGIARWLPGASDLGPQRVQLIVTDSDGNTDSQTFVINVAPPVNVPDLTGNDATAAAAALEAVGLVSGNVTEAFSLTVPAGEVLSQSVAGGSSSAAGAFVDYVISLGPPPIFVPALGNLSVPVAEAALLDIGLALGNVTYVNDANVPRNLVVSQSIGEGTDVLAGTSVDLVVSGGPALSLRLARSLLGNSESTDIDIQAFDVMGHPVALPGDLAINVVADGDASGTPPSVSGNQLLTSADTQGGYRLSVSSASLGLDVSEAFLVSSFFNNDELQSAYGIFSSQLQKANALVSGIVDALGSGDLPAVQALGVELRTLRQQLDLEALRMTPAVALESGFLPDTAPDMETASDTAFAATLPPVIAAVRDSRLFLEQLNAGAARNDDVRARFLNTRLEQAINLLDPDTLTRRGTVLHAARLHQLLSVEIPRLLAADLDRALSILVAEGLLTSVPEDPAAFYARQITPLHADLEAAQPAFFTAIGMMSATSIRSTIIKIAYKPILQAILKNAQNLVINELVKALSDVRNIPGIVTGASQSFHIFEANHSIVEAYSYYGYPDGYVVQLVGPTLLSDLGSAVSSLAGVKFSSMKDTVKSLISIKNAAQALQSVQDQFAEAQPVWVENGCVFDIEPECQQLSFVDGLPVVYKGSNFPAPVLIIVHDIVAGTVSMDNFLFFPKK
ncbi:MAG TPA: PASTA domain-containing protein, partial [Thiotrichales bacterium]|nr:PASTA domain-containing protein [Thiotrichales bacterium]